MTWVRTADVIGVSIVECNSHAAIGNCRKVCQEVRVDEVTRGPEVIERQQAQETWAREYGEQACKI